MLESTVSRDSLLRLSRFKNLRLFRNNVGQGWVGKVFRPTQKTAVFVSPGDIVIRAARAIKFGLMVGSGDYVGWQTIVVTPEMVGQKVAVFTSLEMKTADGSRRKEQKHFAQVVIESGGRAGFARTPDEAEKILIK